jgi:hypothetical protein
VVGRARAQALAACGQILVPLTRLLIALGISAPEFAASCKWAYVQAAVDRLAGSKKRINRSRVAIVTGLTRAEVTRLLKTKRQVETLRQHHLHRARRVLEGWRADSEFATRSGLPRELPLKGRRGSFQALVKRYSGDIPPRAMLDELYAMAVIRRVRSGRVRMAVRPRVLKIGPRELAALGNKGRALLDALCHNLENPTVPPLFAGTATGFDIDPRVVDLLLQRIQVQGREFLARVEDQFKHPPGQYRPHNVAGSTTLGVTVFAHRGVFNRRRNGG